MAADVPGGVATLYLWIQYSNVPVPTTGLLATSFEQVTRRPANYYACGLLRRRAGVAPGAAFTVPPTVNPLIPGAPAPVAEVPAATAQPNVPGAPRGAGAPVVGNVPAENAGGAGQDAASGAGN